MSYYYYVAKIPSHIFFPGIARGCIKAPNIEEAAVRTKENLLDEYGYYEKLNIKDAPERELNIAMDLMSLFQSDREEISEDK